MTRDTQLLGISNAIVDILTHVEPEFLATIGAEPGSMTLIDAARASDIYGRIGPAIEMSGGSVGNTVAGFAVLGGRAAYIGRVADDQFGAVFAHDMRSLGIDLRLAPETRSAPTAQSLVLITPDGQRTMQTYLGACTEIDVADISPQSVGAPGIVLIEGYILDTPQGPAAVSKAIDLARANGSEIALSLSDALCVERHLELFRSEIGRRVSIVVANEAEIKALFGVGDFDEAVSRAAAIDALFALTRSEQGSVIVRGDERHRQDAIPVARVVDTTGAGDAYTAGFLHGYARGRPLPECAELGSICAAEIIQQVGARLQPEIRERLELG